jgi:hypothetical protein
MRTPRMRQKRSMTPRIVVIILGLLVLLSGDWDGASGQSIYQAAIHQGTCDVLGRVVFALSPDGDATIPEPTPDLEHGPPPPFARIGPETLVPVWRSDPTPAIDVRHHALVLHDAAIDGRIVACGMLDAGMTLDTAGSLWPSQQRTISLAEHDHSGVSGRAVLAHTENGLSITLYIYSDAAREQGMCDVLLPW